MGGLWSTNEDGSQTKKLLSMVDIHALFPTTNGVIVLEGVAHMTGDDGGAYFVSASSWATAQARKLADLHSSPEASVQETPEAVLVATNKAVLRVASSGTIETLFTWPNRFLVPRSILLADRTIYVSMRGYVVRLLPTSTGYEPEWLSPAERR
jgi:hypothetical protein